MFTIIKHPPPEVKIKFRGGCKNYISMFRFSQVGFGV